MIVPLMGVVAALAAGIHAHRGYSHGTTEVVLVAPDSVLIAADSKQVYSEFRRGKRSSSQRDICKAVRIGPYYAFVAGIVSGRNGFNSLKEAQRTYLPGDSLDDIAESIAETLPIGIRSVMETVRAIDPDAFRTYATVPAVTITLAGRENDHPRVIVTEFYLQTGPTGSIEVRSKVHECPGDCAGGNAAYFPGIHDAIDQSLTNSPLPQGPLAPEEALHLLQLEYAARPDAVGGPPFLLQLSRTGETILQHGACPADWGDGI
ncbi:MAG TPA: hypothetical protein VHB50_21385 [Bryobacteraceae bacterium]|nr:hypothetical protein [Bryobacteraceae bacterium]